MAHSPDESPQQAHERATRIVSMAWQQLPREHRHLLEEVGAAQRKIVDEPVGESVHRLLRSANLPGLSEKERSDLAAAIAVWIADLRIVVLNLSHPLLSQVMGRAWEHAIARTMWHEWGHALSIARCTNEDVAAGRRLLSLAPTAVRENIRSAGYRAHEYTHELVAEIYAMMIERRQRKESGAPPWLNQEIYELLIRATGWQADDR